MSKVQGRTHHKHHNRHNHHNSIRDQRKPASEKQHGSSSNQDEDIQEHEQCVICAERMTIAAISPCTHTTCHRCTFRQRALYEKKSCLVCRSENEKLIFTEQLDAIYNEVNPAHIVVEDDKYGIAFTSQHVFDDTMELLTFRCQICQTVASDMKSLSDHIRQEHEKTICTICSRFKKAFPSELKIYTQKQLQNHQMRGDEKGFKGHPLCKFCKGKRFYSDDELRVHLRESHEKCHVCDQLDPSNPQYFKNYEVLEEHFKHDHYSCRVQSCLDKKFVVFADELDLQAHMITEHRELSWKGQVVGTTPQGNNVNGRYQLSTFRSSQGSSSSRSGSTATQEAGDSMQTKRMRFEERAKHYLNNSVDKFEEFTSLNNKFRNGQLTVDGLKEAYLVLFNKNSEHEVYLLLFGFSKLFPDGSTNQLKLASFVEEHEKRAAQEHDFPALPGSSTSLSSYGGSNWGNKQPSKKNKNSRQNIQELFPALPTATSYTPVKTTVKYSAMTNQSKPPVVKVNKGSNANFTPTYLSKPTSSASSSSSSLASQRSRLDDNSFPELPKAPPKKTFEARNPANKSQVRTETTIWGTSIKAQPARDLWGNVVNSSGNSSNGFNLDSLDNALPTKGKGKKKKAQVLFTMGGR